MLGVPPGATMDAIKRAYKRKALEFHPDKNPAGEAMFKQLTVAYQALSSAEAKVVAPSCVPPLPFWPCYWAPGPSVSSEVAEQGCP